MSVTVIMACQAGSAGADTNGQASGPQAVAAAGAVAVENVSLLARSSRAARPDDEASEGAARASVDGREAAAPPRGRSWSIDYRVRRMVDSATTYEFGTPLDEPEPFAPLSRLSFSLDSTWHGLQFGLAQPKWRVQCEWLTPMQQHIAGVMADYDWNIDEPADDPSRLDSLTHSFLRWNDGHMVDLGGAFKLADRLCDLPIEFWPMAGFRFQKFDMMASDLVYLVPADGPDPSTAGVDVIAFDQHYYVGYCGGQWGTTWRIGQTPLAIRFQGDVGPVAGHNVDHHLLREGDRYTIERTSGGAWHMALGLDVPLTRHLNLGCQADYLDIRTTGRHRLLNEPLEQDLTWTNGVLVTSQQASLAVYVRASF